MPPETHNLAPPTASPDANVLAYDSAPRTNVRYLIIFVLFVVTTVNYADRATLSMVETDLERALHLDPAAMGYVFSAFGWAYVIAQLPGGWLLDRFGSKKVYALSILLWSIFTSLQGFVGIAGAAYAVTSLFVLRFLVGLAEAPSFPGNSRIVSAWFPTKERGTASAIFNSAQYFATVMFAPLMGWITHSLGWRYVFFAMGGIGIAIALVWSKVIYGPREHPRVGRGELEYIEQNGALVDLDHAQNAGVQNTAASGPTFRWDYIRQLLASRMLVGVYIGQYCITTLTYFFITWFPAYLVKDRGMSILKAGFVASLPAVCGFVGGVLGGMASDLLLRRGHSLTFSRKAPIVVGMLMSCSMIACNYVSLQWLVIAVMSVAFFGKGIGALGWTVVADTSPKEFMGVSGALFNMFGNTAAITTPIVIGYLIRATGNFKMALVFVGANAIGAIACYLLVVGEIRRLELRK